MSNNRDDQKKDPLRSSDPKRPHATLDLKAVEIKSAEQRAADAKTTASSTASAAGPKTETSKTDPKPDTVKPGTSAASAGAAGTTGSSKSETGKGDTGKGTSPTDAAFKSKSQPPPRDMPPLEGKSGSGFGRFVSHMLAGIVGGRIDLESLDQGGRLGEGSFETVETRSRTEGMETPEELCLVGTASGTNRRTARPERIIPLDDDELEDF